MNKKTAQANTKKVKVKVKNRFHHSTAKEITPGKARYLSTMLKDHEPPIGKMPKTAKLVVGSKHFSNQKPKGYSMSDASKALSRNRYYEVGSETSVYMNVREMITVVEPDKTEIVNMTQFTQKKLENEHKEAEFEKQLNQQPRAKKAA